MKFIEYYDHVQTLYRAADLGNDVVEPVHIPRVGDKVSFADTREQYVVKGVNWYYHTGQTTSNGSLCQLEGVYILVEQVL